MSSEETTGASQSSKCSQIVTHRSFCRIRRSNAAASGANLARAKLDFLETVNGNVEVRNDRDAVRDEDTVVNILQALLFQHCQLRKEGGHVEDNTRADEVDLAVLGDQTTGEKVEAIPD